MRDLRRISGARLRGSRRAVAAAAVAGALAFAGFAMASGFAVSLGKTGPSPSTVTINWGDTVTFANSDTVPHAIKSSLPELSSPMLAPGQTFTSVLKAKARTYNYHQVNSDGRGSLRASVVAQVNGSVSLKTSKPAIAYGQQITLSGNATFSPVSLQEHQVRVSGWKQIRVLTPDASGAYSTTLTPKTSVRYRATIAGGQLISKQTGVLVTPTLKIASTAKRTKANHQVTITSRLNPGSAATGITLLGCNSLNPAWVNMMTKKPGSSGGVTFNVQLPRGTNYLRTTVLGDAITTGFVRPVSNKISIVGIAAKTKPATHPRKKPPKPSLRPPRHC